MNLNKEKIMPQLCIGTVGHGIYTGNYNNYVKNLKKAIDIGYNHIDCADCYGIPNDIMKEIIHYGIEKYGRENFWITWKSDYITEDSIVELLGILELDYFDLFLIHHDSSCVRIRELEILANMKYTTHTIKNIGVSNCYKIDKLLEYNTILNDKYGFSIYAIEIQARPTGVKINKRNNIDDDFYDKCNINNIKILLFSPISGFLNKIYQISNENKFNSIYSNINNIKRKIIEYYIINYIKGRNNTIIIGISAGDGYKKSFRDITKILEDNTNNNILRGNTTVKNLLNNIGLANMSTD